MQSLKDKLLKAGLVTEEAAKRVETAARPPRRPDGPRPRQDERPVRDERPAPPPARLPKFAPLPGSKEASRQQSKKQLELDRALRERVLATQLAQVSGETPFYFVTRKNKLRRLELSAEQAQALEAGALAIVERPDPDRIEHALVPAAVAKELPSLHAKAVRFLKAPDAAVGFLSDAEISARAHEANGVDAHEGDEGGAADAAPAPDAAAAPADGAGKPAEAETWIAIRRAPRP
jgi:uncharacterized protein YaiL (DUF2058 family)